MAEAASLPKKIRVLIVDDSALARKILSTGLAADRRLEVIGTAPNPAAAYERLAQDRPDVLTLDIEMPGMDGVNFLRMFMPQYPTPTVVVSSLAERGKKLALDALEAGAVDIVTKPKIGIADGLTALMDDLCERVVAAARANVSHYRRLLPKDEARSQKLEGRLRAEKEDAGRKPADGAPQAEAGALAETTDRVIAIGASAGGVATLARILPMFPADAPGIVIVQHMPAGFTASFAARLDSLSAMQVKEAEQGDRVRPGLVLVAPGGEQHMEVRRSGGEYRVALWAGPKVSGHRPSVNVLFQSVARHAGRNAAAALLTGMGDDGANGLLAIRQAGGRTFAQDEQTCVVFGMPAEAWKLGAAEALLPVGEVPGRLLRAATSLFEARGS